MAMGKVQRGPSFAVSFLLHRVKGLLPTLPNLRFVHADVPDFFPRVSLELPIFTAGFSG